MNYFTNKKHQYKYNAITSTLLVAGIIFVAGLISAKLFVRLDLTKNKEFSISKTTVETMENLDDIVNIKAYFSEKLPAEFLSVKQSVQDILDEYKNYSNGNLKVEFIDPKDDEELQKEARNYGIPELQFSNVEKDKYEISKGYLGLVILYSSNKEVIPAIDNTANLEYDLTSAIRKAARTEPLRVRFLTGHGELDQEEDISILYKELGRLYEVSTTDISNGNLIPDNVKALVIAGPTEKFSARDKYVIDQFLMDGGNLLVLNSGAVVGDGLSARKNETGLEELISNYGISLNRNIVIDPSCETARFTSGYTTFITPYPFWPRMGEDRFNKENAITAGLENLVLPWASSIELEEGRLTGSKSEKLVMSSEKSWLMEDSFNIAPDRAPEQGEQKQSILAVSVSGKFESFFKDKAVPEKPKKEEAAEDEFLSEEEKEKEKKTETESGRIIAVGNTEFIKDNFLKQFPDNIVFFQNALDSLAMDEALMTIRSKTASLRPLKNDISDGSKSAAKFLNIFLVSILLAIIGIVRWMMRRKSNEF